MNYDDLGPHLDVRADGPVKVLTLNVPEKRNAFSHDLHHAMSVVWDRLMDDDETDAVVLTGAGDTFSAGGDIELFPTLVEDAGRRRAMFGDANRMVRSMLAFDRPVVAAVNGPAIGLGCSTALMCDLVVMSDDTFMSDPHVSVGLVAGDGGPLVWPQIVGLLRAKEYVLLGERVPAEDCRRMGLANRVVPRDEVVPLAMELAHRLAAQPRMALRDTKRAFNLHVQQLANLILPFAFAAESECYTTQELQDRVSAFLDRTGSK